MPMFFAGLWASWRPKDEPDAEWLATFTILTRAAALKLAAIHYRMPIVPPENSFSAWVSATSWFTAPKKPATVE